MALVLSFPSSQSLASPEAAKAASFHDADRPLGLSVLRGKVMAPLTLYPCLYSGNIMEILRKYCGNVMELFWKYYGSIYYLNIVEMSWKCRIYHVLLGGIF